MTTPNLSSVAVRALIAKAHHLKPVVLLGAKGLTNNALAEIDNALTIHELIKVKLTKASAAEKEAMAENIATTLNANLLRVIGNTAIFYRLVPEKS